MRYNQQNLIQLNIMRLNKLKKSYSNTSICYLLRWYKMRLNPIK